MKRAKQLDRLNEGQSRSLVVSVNITEIERAVIHAPSLAVLSVGVRKDLAVYAAAAAHIASQSPVYLELPAAASSIAFHPLYAPARSYGRAEYRDEMYELDAASGRVLYSPVRYRRIEVLDKVDFQVRIPHDRRLAVSLSLAWRVGFVIGWLSGLAVVQPKEAREGLVVLTALVLPLMQSSGQTSGLLPARKMR